jgi:hypothetical protein
MRTDPQTIIAAMRHLAATIQSDDGVANAAIAEAADRLDEMEADKTAILAELRRLLNQWEAAAKVDARNKVLFAAAFCSGITNGLATAIEVVEAGGALLPEDLSDSVNQVSE